MNIISNINEVSRKTGVWFQPNPADKQTAETTAFALGQNANNTEGVTLTFCYLLAMVTLDYKAGVSLQLLISVFTSYGGRYLAFGVFFKKKTTFTHRNIQLPAVPCTKLFSHFYTAHPILGCYWLIPDWEGLPRGRHTGRKGGWLQMFQSVLVRRFCFHCCWRGNRRSVNPQDRWEGDGCWSKYLKVVIYLDNVTLSCVQWEAQRFITAAWSERGRLPCSISWLAAEGIFCINAVSLWQKTIWVYSNKLFSVCVFSHCSCVFSSWLWWLFFFSRVTNLCFSA